ncbi:ATP-binding protein [Marinobacterium sp. xm-d-564]|uniref:ATP-binding protein n=1 Tax=Marinobacterium sp. xm-d-564 TaxID=2497742 RepID=UPI00156A0A81|nr:transporter substrate-binding domain-containing protein [Marinobacterium sp. xm-d-564]
MPTYSNWRPFNYVDAGQPKGYLIDLTRQISQKLGLELRFVNGFEWSQHMEKLADGQLDVVGNMVLTEERQQRYLFSEKQTLELLTGLVSLKGYTRFADLDGQVVGIQKDSIFESYFKKNYPQVRYKEYLSFDEMMVALLNGKIDLFVENYSIANYLINVSHIFNEDLQVRLLESEPGLQLNMHFAFNQQDRTLKTLFDKAYDSFSPDEIRALQELWSMVPNSELSPFTKESLQKLLYLFFATLGIILLLLYRYHLLSKQSSKIALINKQLEQERSELERLNEAYTYKAEEAERLSLVKSEFLANMSHEIRTPMNAVLTLAQTLARAENANKPVLEKAKKILRAGQSLQKLIDDILDFSKIESGKLKLVTTEFYLDELLETVALLMSSSVKSKNVHLAITPSYQGNLKISGDQQRLEQILINLISNAIKFTSRGSVELTVNVINADSVPRLRFAIRDTGIGMSDEVLAKILRPFEQGDGSITRKFGGTGLGLSITQQLLSLMGSELSFESQQFRGTTVSFELTLPVKVIEPDPITEARVLIACKNPFTRNSLVAVAKTMGLDHEVGQTQSYLIYQLLSAIKADRSFDSVIVDEEMSGNNLQRLEAEIQSELLSKGVNWSGKLVTVTSPVSHIEEYENSPYDCLIEPVTSSTLKRIINSDAQPETEHIPSQRLLNRTLLVVDDNLFNRDSAREFLEAEGASVILAKDGSEAIKLLRAAELPIDLVLMDVQMPVIDGLEATQRIRALRRFENLPIIGMSAGAYAEDIEKALESGMNNYITKPVDIEKAVVAIAELIAPEALKENAISTNTNQCDIDRPQSYFDIALARDYWSSDETAKKYVAQFIEKYAQTLESLQQESDELNVEFIHKMKGASSILGMPQLTENLMLLEALLRNGKKLSAEQVATLVAVWAETKREALTSLEP